MYNLKIKKKPEGHIPRLKKKEKKTVTKHKN